MEYLSLGKILDSFGLDGTLKIYSTTTNGKMRYKTGATVFLFNPENNERTECKVLNYRHNGLFDFVKLDKIQNKDDAISKKGCEIHVEKNQNDLQKEQYYFCDLVGCKILDNLGKNLGIVGEIEEFPAQLTLRVKRDKQEDFFVPFVKEFIKEVDITKKVIVINVIEGLLWKLRF